MLKLSLLDLHRLPSKWADVFDRIIFVANVGAFRHPDHGILRDGIARSGLRRCVVLRGKKAVMANGEAIGGGSDELRAGAAFDGVSFDDDILEDRRRPQLRLRTAGGERNDS